MVSFVGVWSDTAFNRVEIRETVGGLDDDYFGEFFSGATPIPEPSTFLLLVAGILGVSGIGYWRRKSALIISKE